MTIEAKHRANGLFGVVRTSWNDVPADEDGQVIFIPNHADKTLDVWGTFAGATAVFQACNDDRAISASPAERALVSWKTLKDVDGDSCSFTAVPNKLYTIHPNAYYMRMLVTGGDGTTSITFSLTSRL
jgi:hypothetical protein